MATIALCRLPFNDSPPLMYEYEGPIIDWLIEHFPHGFGCVIRVEVNGAVIPIDDLDIVIGSDDICTISSVPSGPTVLTYALYAIISIAVSYVVQRVFAPDAPKAPGFADQPQPNSIYSVAAAQENAPRLGEPIPVIYGDVMTTPDLAMQTYYAYTESFLPIAPGPGSGVINYQILDFSFNAVTGITPGPAGAVYLWEEKPIGSGSWSLYPTGSATPGLIDTQFAVGIFTSLPWNLRLSPSNTNAFAGGSTALPPRASASWFLMLVPSTIGSTTIERTKTNDGEQYLCQLFCVGLGDFEAFTPDRIKVGNSFLSQFDPSYYSLLNAPPAFHLGIMGNITNAFPVVAGAPSFHENVVTALEVGGQELKDLNDETAFFPVAQQPVQRIAIDIMFPRGLYKIDSSTGDFENINVEIQIIIQVQNNAGVWGNHATRTVNFSNASVKNVSPWRRSLVLDIGSGIYRVKLKRLSAAGSSDGTVNDAFQWIGLRGYISLYPNGNIQGAYGNTHLIALRLKATDTIAAAASTRIRARARRLLNIPASIDPINPGVHFTQNPVAHCYDVVTNTDYGGRRLPDEFDAATFSKLYFHWAGANGFNGAFNDSVTIFEALTSILQTVAAAPLAIGGQISARYEGVKPLRMQLFTDANIVQDSLSINYNFDAVGDFDGVRIEYRDPNTWEPEYYLHPSKAVYPDDVNLFGCTDTLAAVQMAAFIYQWRRYQHKSIRFDVELEGNLPRPGDRIAVQHQLIRLSVGGMVAEYTPGSLLLTLDRPLDFIAGASHAIILRNPDGTPGETRGATFAGSRIVQLSAPLTMPIALATDDNPTLFAFGTTNHAIYDYLLDSATHSAGNIFSLEGTVYDEAAYQGAMPYLTQPVT